LLSAYVVGPELKRAQVVHYRVRPVGRLAPSARALRRHGRSLGLGEVFEALPLCIDVFLRRSVAI
jgi:hypothetical protein